MNCSNCGKYIPLLSKWLTDTKGNHYCCTKCHWEGTHKEGGVNERNQMYPNKLRDTED